MNICGILNLPVRKREDRGLAVWGPFSKEMAYWCNPANLYRHARLRSVRSDRRAWSFHDYDAQGRETARLEQLDGSPFPDGLAEVSHLAELPEGCSAKATVTSYEPPEGDSRDRNDAFLPRRRETWVMRTGKVPVLVGAETWLYTRASDALGVALRTCVHASGAGETLRTETTVEYPEDDYAVPKELRGRTISQSGPLADFFRHRFSTKYFDIETGLYYYGYRFYHPIIMRWLNRDPIGENGGCNVYVICNNNVMQQVDYLGLYLWYVLYYDENKSGSNFKRAAETRKRLIETSSAFNSNCDSVEMYSIRTDNDFFSVWNTLNAHSRKKSKRVTRFQVKGLYLYTHSGPGQLFLRNSTANSLQIKKLPPLNWALQAEIQCLGCNSGVENSSGDSLAGSFYESQQVPTLGQAAASTFSSNPNNKSKWGVVLGFSDVYLWAFDDKGNRIAPIRYPKK